MKSSPAPEPYLHTLDPFAIQFWEGVGIRWYGLSYLMGFLLGYALIHWMGRRGASRLTGNLVGDFVFWVAVGTVVGGRLGYCLFYRPELLLDFSSSFPFWGAIAVNKGGMASHGGMIGIVVACYLFARKHDLEVLHLFDLTIFGATLGIFFGRIANFVNGELVGRACPTDHPLAVKFPQDILAWPVYHPERLQSLTDLALLRGVPRELWNRWLSQLSSSNSWQQVNSTLESIVSAVQSGNTQVQVALAPLLTPRYPSQLFAALLEGLLLFVVLFFFWRIPRKPGVITALFFSGYALVRILNEQFREPDLHLGFQLLSLTRGQWLSVALFLIGTGCLFLWSRADRPKRGGWMKSV